MTILARRGERRHARDRTILRVTRIFFCDFEVVFNMKRKITKEEREKVRGVVVDFRRHHRRRLRPPSRDRFSDRLSSLSPRASPISTVTKILKTTRRRINITRERERAALRIFGVDDVVVVVVVILVVVRVDLFVRAPSSNHEFVL